MPTTTAATAVRVGRRADLHKAGVVAGPLFLAVSAAQLPLNPGLDLTRHAFSFLELGPQGWIQQANFVVAGGLYLAAATGLQLTGRGRLVVPVLLGVLGAGLVLAGVFPPDPSLGYPAGAPEGVPDTISATSVLHGVGFVLGTLAWVAMLATAAGRLRRAAPRRAAACAVMAALLVAVPAVSGVAGGTVYLYAAVSAGLVLNSWLLSRPDRLDTQGGSRPPRPASRGASAG